jgi:hypothetical protein
VHFATSKAAVAFRFCTLDSVTMSTGVYQAKVMIGDIGDNSRSSQPNSLPKKSAPLIGWFGSATNWP